MAVGISKEKKTSEKTHSIGEVLKDPTPLPPNNTKATFTYLNKASINELIQDSAHNYINLKSNEQFETPAIPHNSFILDDNFFSLNKILEQGLKVDLVYLDPPYGTGLDFQTRDLKHAYTDRMGQATYIEFMRRRLILIREVMAEDASIYVHIGHQMLAHFKVILDEIFGEKNFKNLITRRTCSSKNFTRNQYPNLNDYILFYTKGKKYKWNQPGVSPDQDWIDREYSKIDELGRRFKLVPIHAPGVRNGETGKPWRGMMPPKGKHWQYVPAKLEEFDKAGDIHWSRNGNPRRKVYWTADKQLALPDYWDQYRDAHHQSVRITGYPTEKNFDMLKMIVEASSNEGDLVLDPFCGSGTTIHAARDLNRKYIGIDASFSAAKATLKRMMYGMEKMGDYVSQKTSRNHNLFSTETRTCCNFIINEKLMINYSDEIRAISKSTL